MLRGSAVLLTLGLLAGCSQSDPDADSESTTTPSASPSDAEPTGSTDATEAPESTESSESSGVTPTETVPPPDPVSVPGLAAAELPGSDLRIGAVREQTAAYTSYDVTFSSTREGRLTGPMRISGVLNVPTGRGPFPAAVLAHGYIDPAYYVRGQGMTRERGYLADRGYVTLHVDYRNHAESADDPRADVAVRLGYSTDVIAAARALIDSPDVRVDEERIALFGRSMGGGVMLRALEIDPDLFAAGVGWASVSSLEAENFEHFRGPEEAGQAERDAFVGRFGTPEESPDFWRDVSARPFFDQISAPVLMVHGRNDSTCPPRWATATDRALRRAGVDATLEWYDDEHAFGPAFNAAMDRTVRFLDAEMPA